MTALLPCPFCGSDELHAFEHSDSEPSFGFQCIKCWMTSSHHASRAQAITAWNTRPSPARDEGAGTMGRGEEFLEFKEALDDVRRLRSEYECLNGGGPGWALRDAAAWKRVDALFAAEDEAAYDRQQEDAHG